MPKVDEKVLVKVNDGWSGYIDVTFTEQTPQQLSRLISTTRYDHLLRKIEDICLKEPELLKARNEILLLIEKSGLLR